MTRFASTTEDTGSAVSTGVGSERPAPNRVVIPRERMFHAAFASLSASNPHAGHECAGAHHRRTTNTGASYLLDFQILRSSFSTLTVLIPFEFELDAQLSRAIGRPFPFGFDFECQSFRGIHCDGLRPRLQGDRTFLFELFGNVPEVRRDFVSALGTLGFEQDFFRHILS